MPNLICFQGFGVWCRNTNICAISLFTQMFRITCSRQVNAEQTTTLSPANRHNRIHAQMPISAQNNSTTIQLLWNNALLLGWLPQWFTYGELTTTAHSWRSSQRLTHGGHHNGSLMEVTTTAHSWRAHHNGSLMEVTTMAHSWRAHHNGSLVESSPQQLTHGAHHNGSLMEVTTTAHSWRSPQLLTRGEFSIMVRSCRSLHSVVVFIIVFATLVILWSQAQHVWQRVGWKKILRMRR